MSSDSGGKILLLPGCSPERISSGRTESLRSLKPSGAVATTAPANLLILSVDAEGNKYIGREPATNDALLARIREAAQGNAKTRVRFSMSMILHLGVLFAVAYLSPVRNPVLGQRAEPAGVTASAKQIEELQSEVHELSTL